MLPTPATPSLPDSVYPPSEDSYLILDTLSSASETTFLSSRFSTPTTSPLPTPCPLITELGTGSGIILAFLTAHAATIFGRSDVACLGLDLSGDACQVARGTVDLACRERRRTREQRVAVEDSGKGSGAGTFLDTFQGDLTGSLRRHSVDVLVFNPPYVPTDGVPGLPPDDADGGVAGNGDGKGVGGLSAFERDSRFLDVAVAGGVDGMGVTGRLLFGDAFGSEDGRREGEGEGEGERDGERNREGVSEDGGGVYTGLDEVLSKDRGVAYVLLSVRNRPKEVVARLRGEVDNVDTVDEDEPGVQRGEGRENVHIHADGEHGAIKPGCESGGKRQRRKKRWSSVEIVGATGRKGGIESLVVVRIAR